jgi:spermidine synthase
MLFHFGPRPIPVPATAGCSRPCRFSLLLGARALIYQVLWLRLLGLVFGVTTYAASTVWAVFMAGLAVGGFAASRIADRVRRPLLWFGAIRAGISRARRPAVAHDRGPGRHDVRGAHPADALMGATLPLVIKSSTFKASRIGERRALLYGMNTASAIVGALAAGPRLIQTYRIRTTFFVAAALSERAARQRRHRSGAAEG